MLTNLKLTLQNKVLLVSFLIFIFLATILALKNKKNSDLPAPENINSPLYADTMIPKGQVLIPIELENIDAISGLIDQYGLIDLYSGGNTESVLVAGRIKLLRAPLNPNKYAVMVSETHSHEIMKFKGPFTAVVQNRFTNTAAAPPVVTKTQVGALPKNLTSENRNQRIEIEYYQGGDQ